MDGTYPPSASVPQSLRELLSRALRPHVRTNLSSRINISSFWTNIMMDQVIIGLLSFMLRHYPN